MKKLFILIQIFLLSAMCFADDQNNINVLTICSGMTIATGSTWSKEINMDSYQPNGFTSLDVYFTGTGSLRVYHESSNDLARWATAKVNGTSASDIITTMGTGNELHQFSTPFCKYMKLNFVASGSDIVVDAKLAIQ